MNNQKIKTHRWRWLQPKAGLGIKSQTTKRERWWAHANLRTGGCWKIFVIFLVQNHPVVHLYALSSSLMLTGLTNEKGSNQISLGSKSNMAIWQTASHLCNAVSFEVNQVMPKNTFEYNHVVPCPGTRLLVRQNKWRLEVFSNASPCSWPTVSWNKHEGRSEPNDIIHEKTHQQGNTSSLNVHVSPLPLSLLPPLSVFEVRIQIHNAPNFTRQGLNYMGFWFCKPEFIAASLIPQAARTIWNTTMIKPQRFCSMCLRAVRGPPFISSVRLGSTLL